MEKQEEAVFSSWSAQPKQEEASPDIWHQRLGHIQPTAVTHLPVSTNGAKLAKGPMTIECEVCSVSKAHEIVSRRPNPRAMKPYECIHIDLIQMTEAYNSDRWIIHFLCDHTRMNHVFTKPKKSMTLSTIKEFEAWISR